jgi:DNA-binding PadR family transcriptional regulator
VRRIVLGERFATLLFGVLRYTSQIDLDNYIRYGYSVCVKVKGLTPAVFHILLALSTEERHGYGIMKQVEADSLGKVKMGPGTLYGSIKRMLESGLIAESEARVDPEMDDARRIYYRLTENGETSLTEELKRYQHLLMVSKKLGFVNRTINDAA